MYQSFAQGNVYEVLVGFDNIHTKVSKSLLPFPKWVKAVGGGGII